MNDFTGIGGRVNGNVTKCDAILLHEAWAWREAMGPGGVRVARDRRAGGRARMARGAAERRHGRVGREGLHIHRGSHEKRARDRPATDRQFTKNPCGIRAKEKGGIAPALLHP